VLQGFDSTNVIIGNSQNAYNINRVSFQAGLICDQLMSPA
jgi:hypothetical protein